MAVKRRLTFYAWADTSENHPFDRVKAASGVRALDPDEIVFNQGEDTLTAVEIRSPDTDREFVLELVLDGRGDLKARSKGLIRVVSPARRGAPNTAKSPSPTYLSTCPPCAWMIGTMRSKRRLRVVTT